MFFKILGSHLFLLLLLSVCSQPNCLAAEVLRVFVSIKPQAFIVERIGAENVVVHVLASDAQDPHTFEPDPRQLIQLGNAQLYFKIGLPFETRLLEKIQDNNRTLHVIDASAGIKRLPLAISSHPEKQQAGNTTIPLHAQGQPDPHIWLSPLLVKIIADNTAQALIEADPAHSNDYRLRLHELNMDIDEIHAKIKNILKPFIGQTFYVFHPAFAYFGKTYGLHQEAVELEGKSPSPKQLAAFIRTAKTNNVKVIFVQPQYDKSNAEVVAAALGGRVMVLDPMKKDLLENFKEMADKFAAALHARKKTAY